MRTAADRPSASQAALSSGVTETRGFSPPHRNPSWAHTLASGVTDGIQPPPEEGCSSADGLTARRESTHAPIPIHRYTHTHCMHNTRAYGIHKAHLHAFLPTCFPLRIHAETRTPTQGECILSLTRMRVNFHSCRFRLAAGGEEICLLMAVLTFKLASLWLGEALFVLIDDQGQQRVFYCMTT